MKRINVSFFDEIYKKLEERMKENGDKSIAHSVRELVELGLRIEEAARKNERSQGDGDDLSALINMLKSNLIWSLETRLLARHLVENMPTDQTASEANILETCRERASNYVMGMLGEAVK